MTTEQRLTRIENMLSRILAEKEPEWVSEVDAMKILNRSKSWLQKRRRNKELEFKDMNGRSFEYKRRDILNLKKSLQRATA